MISKRKANVSNQIELEETQSKKKEDIVKRIHSDIFEVVGKIGEMLYDQKNKLLFQNENF